MKGIEVYRGKVVDEDEYVQGILIGEDQIFQYTEDGEWSVNCGIGCFSIIPETIAYCGKMDIGDLTVDSLLKDFPLELGGIATITENGRVISSNSSK